MRKALNGHEGRGCSRTDPEHVCHEPKQMKNLFRPLKKQKFL